MPSSASSTKTETTETPTPPYITRRQLMRFQAMRAAIAVFGGIVAGLGIGLSLNHQGLVGPTLENSIGWPTLAAIAIALTCVFRPIPKGVRWALLAVSTLVFLVLGFEASITYKILLSALGIGLSIVAAHVIRFVLGAASKSGHYFASSFVLLLFLQLVLLAPTPASAQSTTACPSGDLIIRANGEDFSFRNQAAESIPIEITDETASLQVQATSDIRRGTVVVRHVGSTLLPGWLAKPAVVWSGEITPNGSTTDGGSTEPGEILVSQDGPLGTFQVRSDSLTNPIPLLVGESLYRAEYTDAVSGTTCALEARVRLTASPVRTLGGLASLATALVGIGGVAGLLAGGRTRASGPGEIQPPPAEQAALDDSGNPVGPPPSAISLIGVPKLVRLAAGGSSSEGPTLELTLKLDVEEKEREIHEIDVSARGFFELVKFSPTLFTSQGGPGEIPIQLRTKPANVEHNVLNFEIDVTVDGYPLTSLGTSMKEVIDLRTPAIDLRELKPATPQKTSEVPT